MVTFFEKKYKLKPVKIGFLTTLGLNVGDEFIREGIRAILDRIGLEYYPLYVDKHDESSLVGHREDEVIRVADKYWDSEVFIQAGAPVYWHLMNGTSTSLTSEWYEWAWQNRILNASRHDHPLFINLGAGSCQPWGDDGTQFIQNQDCARYARGVADRSLLTVVRDPVASNILTSLSIPHSALPCPAFLAAERHLPSRPSTNTFGVNMMPLGTHYDLKGDFNRERWYLHCHQLVTKLRRFGNVLFICHDAQEKEFARSLATSRECIYHSPTWRDYFDVYAACHIVIANRVHGAVCAAGFGVPSIILGNDTRARIGDYIGLRIFNSGIDSIADIIAAVRFLSENRSKESDRLLRLREATLRQYAELLSSDKVQESIKDVLNRKQGNSDVSSAGPHKDSGHRETVRRGYDEVRTVRHMETLLKDCEADRTARLEAIHKLEALLKESESDRAARLEIMNEQQKMIADRDRSIDTLQREIDAMRSSIVWRMAAPLRWLGRMRNGEPRS
jgi:hypothetical protein